MGFTELDHAKKPNIPLALCVSKNVQSINNTYFTRMRQFMLPSFCSIQMLTNQNYASKPGDGFSLPLHLETLFHTNFKQSTDKVFLREEEKNQSISLGACISTFRSEILFFSFFFSWIFIPSFSLANTGEKCVS